MLSRHCLPLPFLVPLHVEEVELRHKGMVSDERRLAIRKPNSLLSEVKVVDNLFHMKLFVQSCCITSVFKPASLLPLADNFSTQMYFLSFSKTSK